MSQAIIDFLSRYFTRELVAFLISMLPIFELRGGLIAASAMGIPWVRAALICFAGNILPIPIILLFIKKILAYLKGTKAFHKLGDHFEQKALKKGAELLEKHPRGVDLALCLFVGIPLPLTGAWTGSLIAAFLDLPVRRSLPMIVLGVAIAACLMLALAYLAPALIGLR